MQLEGIKTVSFSTAEKLLVDRRKCMPNDKSRG
jgi:hypothetical protein